MRYVQYVIDAIGAGVGYALVAMGIGLIFGVLRLINFAHGELLTVGGYTLYLTKSWPSLTRVAVVIVVVVATAMLIERLALRPIRHASPVTMLAMTFAVSFFLRAVMQRQWSNQTKQMNLWTGLNKSFELGSLRVKWSTPLSIVVGAVILSAVALLLNRTSIGLQMRAAAADFTVARSLGISANRVISLTFGLAGLLAAIALILIEPGRSSVSPDYGLQVGVVALVGVVVGGMERLTAATLGGFAVGFFATFMAAVLPSNQRVFLDTAVYGAVIAVLLIRPTGVFQRSQPTVRV
jgi:branched-chain amino acid transport system permease protein